MAVKDAEYFWNKLRSIPPVSIPQSLPLASEMEKVYKQIFSKICTFKCIPITKKENLDLLLPLYMVWYKQNDVGKAGVLVEGSLNYLFSHYVDIIVDEPTKINPEIKEKIYSIHRDGITSPIEIFVAYDTSMEKGVIIDGTKRALALHYLKRLDCWELNANDEIEICMIESPCSRVLIPYDFLKLY